MTDDPRALLDECTNRPTCTATMHLTGCPSSPDLRLLGALQRSVDAARATRERVAGPVLADQLQPTESPRALCEPPGFDPSVAVLTRWERRVPGSDVAIERRELLVDDHGRVVVEEAWLAQLLVDAGWERTS
jgi:hypothetical protein